MDRKTARRYVAAGQEAGLVRDGGEAQLTDELLGVVVAAVRPVRPAGHGAAWETLTGEEQRIRAWVDEGLQLVNIHGKLTRCGVVVPYRTLHGTVKLTLIMIYFAEATTRCDGHNRRIT